MPELPPETSTESLEGLFKGDGAEKSVLILLGVSLRKSSYWHPNIKTFRCQERP